MEVNDALIENLCKLACLEFDAAGKQEIKKDLQKMIGFVEKLNELDLRDVNRCYIWVKKQMYYGKMFRKLPSAVRKHMDNAPNSDQLYFKVPRVVKNPAGSPGELNVFRL